MRFVLTLLTCVIVSAVAQELEMPNGCTCDNYAIHLQADCRGLQWTELVINFKKSNLNDTTRHSLVRLDVSNNSLTFLKGRTFAKLDLKQLEFISLRDNNFETIDSDAFVGVERLKYVDISGNQIRFIPPTIIHSNPMVRHLWLNNNPQLYLPLHGTFLITEHLKRLEVSDCGLTTLPEKTFLEMKGLEAIDLSRNKLSTLPDHVFRTVVGLIDLDLSYNQFNTLSGTALLPLQGFRTMQVDGNPWQCDCRLKALRELFNQRAWHLKLMCEAPAQLRGRLWREVEEPDCATTTTTTKSTTATKSTTTNTTVPPPTTVSEFIYEDDYVVPDVEFIIQNITDIKKFGEIKQTETILEIKEQKLDNIFFSYFSIAVLASVVVFTVLVFVVGSKLKVREAKPVPMGLLEQGTNLM